MASSRLPLGLELPGSRAMASGKDSQLSPWAELYPEDDDTSSLSELLQAWGLWQKMGSKCSRCLDHACSSSAPLQTSSA